MSKELFISSSPHETKAAVLEDDQLVEVYYERDVDVGLVGGIYKGRVSRVLPGMQSAFVDIGLERDAFLYVSDFYEDEEEYDKVFTEAEVRATSFVEESPAEPAGAAVSEVAVATHPAGESVEAAPTTPAPVVSPGEAAGPAPSPAATPPPPSRSLSESAEPRRHEHRGRRRRRGGRTFGDRKYTPRPESHTRPPAPQDYGTLQPFEILPGESLAKFQGAPVQAPPEETEPSAPEVAEAAPPPENLAASPAPEASVEAAPEQETFSPLPASMESGTEQQDSAGISFPAVAEETATPVGLAAELPVEAPAPLEQEQPPLAEAPPAGEPALAAAATQEETRPAPEPEPVVAAAPAEQPPTTEGEVEPAYELEPPAGLFPEPEPLIEDSEDATAPTNDSASALPPTPTGEGSEEHPSAEPPAPAETPAEPPVRTYTLREPHHRPRFAPRRRRGRRGTGNRPRPERRDSARPGNHQHVQIADVLKEGQEILVQIAKEPLGTKGARITSHIALPGRYLVYMPTISHIGVSRKISSEDERLRLRNIILENRGSLTGGFIVRTAGAGRSDDELKADLKFLSTLWGEIRAKADKVKAPALIHRDLDLVQRILRDILSPDFKYVRMDNELEYERCLEFVSRCQPSLVGHVKLHTRKTPLFEEFGIQGEIDKALKPKVWLKSGGYIVINQTEALVAIDVNTGKFVGKTNRLEDTIVKTNIDAVNEIVRQIRLRDVGGIIVIDFIDMDERRNRNKVVQALEEALRRDRAPTKVLSFNDFGLVAITRKRVKQSLERTLCQPCDYCSGSGWIKSVSTVCHEILSEARKMAAQMEGDTMTLRVNPEVAHALKSRQGVLLSELESLTHKDVIIKSDPTVHQERFEIY